MRRGGLAVALTIALTAPSLAREVPMQLHHAHVVPLTFAEMKGWRGDDHRASYAAFVKSCRAILNSSKAQRAKRAMLGGLFVACQQAAKLQDPDDARTRQFFEDNFRPMRIAKAGDVDGFFTGYYETEVDGSPVKTAEYNIPFYGIPSKFKGRSTVFGQYDRTQIESGAIAGKGLTLCWVKDPIDVLFAQIQGSTRVKLPDGQLLRLNYIASNGKPYYPVGKYLIDQGIIARQDMSMDRIRDWMEANPVEGRALRDKNRSYVFFEKTPLLPTTQIIGAQGVPLTPLRSVAVDKSLHIYGTPIWIDANLPLLSEEPSTPFRHLVIAQDTGSAIVGPARADIFFGAGNLLGHVAGRIKDHGEFVMLVPKSVALRGDSPAAEVPLPQPRPAAIATRTAEADDAADGAGAR
ncbi:MAG TPA: MltA domain-containing protein [Pseudolabrys sp.]|nr:MltA domain-containing protein [Pseudolabrys sp.]